MKKALASLALAGILTLSVGSVAAQAAPNTYPAGPPAASVSSGTVTPGASFTFSGSGFLPGETIIITITQLSGVAGGAIGSIGGGGMAASVPVIIKAAAPVTMTTTATAQGTFASNINLGKTGTYTLTATGQKSGVTVSQTVKVVAASTGTGNTAGDNTGNNVSGAQPGALASTGVDNGVIIWSIVGVGALAAGAGTVVVSRRRASKSADA